MTADRTRRSWDAMWQRCTNPRCNRYYLYGAKGVKICQRWRDYRAFLADMGKRPVGKTLDRKNPWGDYRPSNCRWATPVEQAGNRRNSVLLDLNGECACLTVWARRIGLSESGLRNRLFKHGWPVEKALTTPRHPQKRGGAKAPANRTRSPTTRDARMAKITRGSIPPALRRLGPSSS